MLRSLGTLILDLQAKAGLPERVFDPLFDAALGLRVRRPTYIKRSGVEERTATRDLEAMVDHGLLGAHGHTRGRFYTAAGALGALREKSRTRRRSLDDPYPWLTEQLAREARAIDVAG